jgi:hypothetical protein
LKGKKKKEENGKKNRVKMMMMMMIQFNSIHVCLRANLTAEMPITKLALERRKRQQTKNLQKM